MHEAAPPRRRVLATSAVSALTSGDGDVAGGDRGLGQRGEVVVLGLAGLADRDRRRRRDDADRGLGARQRRLEIEHALQPRPVGHDGAHRRAGETSGASSWEGDQHASVIGPCTPLAPPAARANPRLRARLRQRCHAANALFSAPHKALKSVRVEAPQSEERRWR